MKRLACFKAYDIRGRVDTELTEELTRNLGAAIAHVMQARNVVVGRDARADSPRLLDALCAGLTAAGVDVLDLGLCGTEEVYFGTDHHRACAGIMVTASHNPIEYNGFKLVGPGSTPLHDDVFRAIEATTADPVAPAPTPPGQRRDGICRQAYVQRVLSFIDAAKLSNLKILVNAGNGAAGPTFDAIEQGLRDQGTKLQINRLHHRPDARFPNGIPNPLLPENQPATAKAVREAEADFGVAWDGDFDRCFFFDHTGAFVPGEYVVGLLAETMLRGHPRAGIVHDPRVIWNTQDIVARAGGKAVVSKTGHALVKAKMREAGAIYGGEMSAHHYFRDFMHCDSGMIPWLLVAAHLSETGLSLRQVIAAMQARFVSSGEINFRVIDAEHTTQRVYQAFRAEAPDVDWIDGLSMAASDWRLNLRSSNTEPLLRLNVETRGNPQLLDAKLQQIAAQITASEQCEAAE